MWKRTAPPVLITSLLFILLSGCLKIEPTYTKEKISESIISLCQKEYGIEPRVWLLEETVWIYLPVGSLITNTMQWEKDASEKINKVMMGSSRVLLSMNPRPQFMVMVVSDIESLGLDYAIVTWIPDIVKFQLQFISRDEFSRRSLIKIAENVNALQDKEGTHIQKGNIRIKDFLAAQIAQRIRMKFALDDNLKDYFKLGDINSMVEKDTFRVDAHIEQIKSFPQNTKAINTEREIAKIIAYVIREYEIKDFLLAQINNTASGRQLFFTRSELKDYLR